MAPFTLLEGTVAPSIISLFDSTSTSPLSLASLTLDASLPQDSGAALVHDVTSLPAPSNAALDCSQLQLRGDDDEDESDTRRRLDQIVLHLQSPTLRTTYLCIPPSGSTLGLTLPFVHFQLRPLGGRPLSLEVGVVDSQGRRARIRASTFEARPTLKPAHQDRLPLLHLPLSLPSERNSPAMLTSWVSLTLPLRKLSSHLSDASLLSADERRAPPAFAEYAATQYIRVYASCRVRRVWASSASLRDVEPERIAELGVYG